MRVASSSEQIEAASILESLISLAILTRPVDLEALAYIKRTALFFEVRRVQCIACFEWSCPVTLSYISLTCLSHIMNQSLQGAVTTKDCKFPSECFMPNLQGLAPHSRLPDNSLLAGVVNHCNTELAAHGPRSLARKLSNSLKARLSQQGSKIASTVSLSS